MKSLKSVLATRVSLISVDQAIASLSNLAASVIAAHLLSAEEFGAFGLVFATYMLVVFAVRAITGEVLLLVGVESARHNAAANLLIAALTGLGSGAVIYAVVPITGDVLQSGLVPLAWAMGALSVHDTIRYVGFATKRVGTAIIADILWLVFMVLGWSLLPREDADLGLVTTIWVGAGVGAAVCTLPMLGLRLPSHLRVLGWLRDQKALMLGLLADRGVLSAMQQGVVYMIALLIGLEGNAAYRGAQIVMGPINVLAMGLGTAMVPYLVSVWQRHPEAFGRHAIRAAGAASLGLLLLTQLAAGMPASLGRALISDTWTLAEPILRPMGFVIPLQILGFAATGALRAMRRVGVALAARVVISALTLLAMGLAAYVGDINIVVWTQVICATLASLLWWTTFMRTYHRQLRLGRATERVPSP